MSFVVVRRVLTVVIISQYGIINKKQATVFLSELKDRLVLGGEGRVREHAFFHATTGLWLDLAVVVQVESLVSVLFLCSWARQFNLTVPLFTRPVTDSPRSKYAYHKLLVRVT